MICKYNLKFSRVSLSFISTCFCTPFTSSSSFYCSRTQVLIHHHTSLKQALSLSVSQSQGDMGSHASVHWVLMTNYRCALPSSGLFACQGKAFPTKPLVFYQLQVCTQPPEPPLRLGRRKQGPNSHRLQEATAGLESLCDGHFHRRCFKTAWESGLFREQRHSHIIYLTKHNEFDPFTSEGFTGNSACDSPLSQK